MAPCAIDSTPAAFGILINGKPLAQVAATDRGLMYGDGVFRTMRAEQGRIPAWTRHYRKLVTDCAALDIEPPGRETLEAEIRAVLSNAAAAVVKIVVTRGEGGRGYAVPARPNPTRIVLAAPLPGHPPRYRREGVRLHLCRLRLGHQPRLAGVKHLNRLENVLARSEWSDADIPEGLLLDGAGQVIEGTMSNVFLRVGQRLLTPDLRSCGVAGVQRERLLEVAPSVGLVPEVRAISLDELLAAEEVLVCNSVIGLWPVRALADHAFRVGGLVPALERALEALDD